VGKNFPLFQCRHTPKHVLTCQWEKRSICTFEEAVSRRQTKNRPIPSLGSPSECHLTCCAMSYLQLLLILSFLLASNMHVLVRWYQPGGVWKSKLTRGASARTLCNAVAHRVSASKYLFSFVASTLLAWSSLSSPRRLTLAQRAPASPRLTSFVRTKSLASPYLPRLPLRLRVSFQMRLHLSRLRSFATGSLAIFAYLDWNS
jgi:hypothetical protein